MPIGVSLVVQQTGGLHRGTCTNPKCDYPNFDEQLSECATFEDSPAPPNKGDCPKCGSEEGYVHEEVRSNPWPMVITTLVSVAGGLVLGLSIYRYGTSTVWEAVERLFQSQ
jgi:uncharacterized paraquat-inducible protein A